MTIGILYAYGHDQQAHDDRLAYFGLSRERKQQFRSHRSCLLCPLGTSCSTLQVLA